MSVILVNLILKILSDPTKCLKFKKIDNRTGACSVRIFLIQPKFGWVLNNSSIGTHKIVGFGTVQIILHTFRR